MQDRTIERDGVTLHARTGGAGAGAPAVVLLHALGTDQTLWDDVIARLPTTLRWVTFDMRGHGRSAVPPPPYSMGALVSDAEAVCDALAVREAVVVGLSVGGMVAQGLAVKRLDLVRGLVLTGSAARIGQPALWQARINTVAARGLPALADDIVPRWLGRGPHPDTLRARLREMLLATDRAGYAGVCAAISGTDFYTPTSGLRLPTLGIAGAEDRLTPPDLQRETVALVPGADFTVLRRVGHLACIEAPQDVADLLVGFLHRIGHLSGAAPD